MKKILKGLFALVLATSAVAWVPEKAIAASVDITDGLVGYYTLEQDDLTNGITNNSTSETLFGNIDITQGDNLVLETVELPTGQTSKMLHFVNNSELSLDLKGHTGSYSVSMWINADDVSNQMSFLHQYGAKNILSYKSDASKRFYTYLDASNTSLSSYELTANKWVHLSLVHDVDADTLTLYINGAVQNSHSLNTNSVVETTKLLFGRHKSGGDPFLGYMDEIRVYNKAISDDEALAIYEDSQFDYFVDSEVISTYSELERTNWTGNAYDKNGNNVELTTAKSNDGPVENMLDNNTDTVFHTGTTDGSTWGKVNSANFPVYIVLNLNENVTFNSFSLENRNHENKDAVTRYSLYVNRGNTVIDDTDFSNENWGEPVASNETEGNVFVASTNLVDLDESYTTNQILLKVTSTTALDQSNSESWVVIKDFKLLTRTETQTINRNSWKAAAYITSTKELTEYSDNSEAYVLGSNADQAEGPAEYMFDGNPDTHWHSDWSNVNAEGYGDFTVVIKLGRATKFNAFSWIGRSGLSNGDVEKYKFYALNNTEPDETIAIDDERWGDPIVVDNAVAEGGDVEKKYVGSITATHVMVRMVGKKDNSGSHGSCGEFYLFYDTSITGELDKKVSQTELSGDWLFESNYADASLLTPIKTATDSSYMRYITPEVLAVKYQTEDVTGGKNIRFVSTVPSLNLEKVGFEFTMDGGTPFKYSQTTVYNTINSKVDGTVVQNDAEWTYGNAASKYFFAFTINGVPSDQTSHTLKVRAFWLPYGAEDVESNYQYGEERTIEFSSIFTAE